MTNVIHLAAGLVALCGAAAASAQDAPAATESASDVAMKLSNPVAALISVPFQKNVDFGLGADGNGWQSRTNIQPVIPVSIARDWNLISRTILPVVIQEGVTGPRDDQLGLGDIVQSLFFSPKAAGPGGIIWGAGPVFLLPSATNQALGAEKWGAGPTAVALKQTGPWTVGILANHIWSFAGAADRQDVSATFMQPFLSYTTVKATTFSANTETTYDWTNDRWVVPINLVVAQLLPLGGQLVQVAVGGRYYVESPTGGPDWGMRFALTFLFPKK